MYINVNPFDSDVAELEQSDIESMWNYLMEEPDNFYIYCDTIYYWLGIRLLQRRTRTFIQSVKTIVR